MKIFQKIKELSFIIGILLLSGCLQVPEITRQSNLNSYPFYITSGLGFPPVKKVSFNMEYIDYHPIDQRIEEYLNNHPVTPSDTAHFMKEYEIAKGMNKEQVMVVTGKKPGSISRNESEEKWIYGSILMQQRAFIITFRDDIVTNIEDKGIVYGS